MSSETATRSRDFEQTLEAMAKNDKKEITTAREEQMNKEANQPKLEMAWILYINVFSQEMDCAYYGCTVCYFTC